MHAKEDREPGTAVVENSLSPTLSVHAAVQNFRPNNQQDGVRYFMQKHSAALNQEHASMPSVMEGLTCRALRISPAPTHALITVL